MGSLDRTLDESTHNLSDIVVDADLNLTGYQLLAADGSSASPGISFANDTDTGFRRIGSNQVDAVLGGSSRFNFSSTILSAENANGGAILNEAASGSNPTIVPDKAALTSGLGGLSGAVTLIRGGVNRIELLSGETVINNSGGDLDFRVEGDADDKLLFCDAGVYAVGINQDTPDASSILDMVATSRGVLFPRMTTTQRDAISTPATGLTIWNTTTGQLEDYNGGWAAV